MVGQFFADLAEGLAVVDDGNISTLRPLDIVLVVNDVPGRSGDQFAGVVQAEKGGKGPVGAKIPKIQILPGNQLRIGIHEGFLEGELILYGAFDPLAAEHGEDEKNKADQQQAEADDDRPEQFLRQFVKGLRRIDQGAAPGQQLFGDGQMPHDLVIEKVGTGRLADDGDGVGGRPVEDIQGQFSGCPAML